MTLMGTSCSLLAVNYELRMDTAEPVSYTHLDVYKRQIIVTVLFSDVSLMSEQWGYLYKLQRLSYYNM